MAVLVQSTVPELTKELYNTLIQQLEAKMRDASGFIAHVAGPIPGGWMVTEIWESPEQFNAWLQGSVMPVAMAAGMNPPIVTMTPALHVIAK